jgi:hypothetical protein
VSCLSNPTLKDVLICFAGHGGLIHSLILERGRFWSPRDLPENVQAGRLGDCFRQARELALLRPECFTYVEGYAYSRVDFCVPVHHAWCVDEYGNVVDPTWSKPSAGVFAGVAFREEMIRKTSPDELDNVVQWGYLETPGFLRKFLAVPEDYFRPKDSYQWGRLPAG